MYPSEIFDKKILICPLNWGMGHVSRCIPLINKLQNQNNQVFIACDKIQQSVFESFVNTEVYFITHEGYPFRFRGRGNFLFDLFLNINGLIKRHLTELSQVKQIVSEHKIEFIISDHRYSFRSINCMSIFMSHQFKLPLPLYLYFFDMWHKRQISKFDFQWIVDDENKRLAGNLSNKRGFPNSKFIGLLSRFHECQQNKIFSYRGILIASGPIEYTDYLINFFKKKIQSKEIELILGSSEAYKIFKSMGINSQFHISNDWRSSDEIIRKSKKIYGFCGYSTLMDLKFLNCESELIPCPGQLEQIYLQKKP